MRFVSYVRKGVPGYGVLVDGGVVELSSPGGARTLREMISSDPTGDVARVNKRAAEFSLGDVLLLPVIPDPGKILCVGLNYETHRLETKRPDAKYPTIFTRFADTQIAHGQAIVKPVVSESLDYEGELAVIIGRGGRNIPEEHALEHVFGYACYNDVTIRDWQRHTHQFTPGKNFPGTGAFGPWVATPDEVGPLGSHSIVTRLNGETMQSAQLSDMIFSVSKLIAYCSAFTPLSAGDVILTGTPGGVGDRREPPVYMKIGDVVEVEISGVGLLSNPIMSPS